MRSRASVSTNRRARADWGRVSVTLLDHFPRAFVINLPERRDRRAQVEVALARAGMPLQPGRVDIFAGVRPTEAAGFPSAGVRGCFLSHLGALRLALSLGLPRVLVFEDDVEPSPLLRACAAELVRGLRERPWGMFYLGHSLTLAGPRRLVEHRGPLVLCHAYAVEGAVLPRLVPFMEALLTRPAGSPEGGPMFPDGAFNLFRQRNPDVTTLLAAPSLARQRPSRSDLSPRWFDRVPGLREATAAARSVRARLAQR